MTTKRNVLARGCMRLAAADVESARFDARVLLAKAMNVAPDELIGGAEPSEAQVAEFERLLARREAREPLAYITGHKEFWSLDFEVGPGALVPRADSETLIEEAMKEFPDRAAPLEVLDLGTGSGCLLIAFLASYSHAGGVGIDSSPDALSWARRNVAKHGLAQRCVLRKSDWADGIDGRYDLVFCNPPYLTTGELEDVAPEIGRFEPRGALDGGENGLAAYGSLGPLIARILKPGGRALLEIGSTQGPAVETVLDQYSLETLRIANDLAGCARCVVAATRPAAHGPDGQKTVGNLMATG